MGREKLSRDIEIGSESLGLDEMVSQYLPKIDKQKAFKAAKDFVEYYKIGSEDLIDKPDHLVRALYATVNNEKLNIDNSYKFRNFTPEEQVALVYRYQKLQGLEKVDGVIGPETKQSLEKNLKEMNARIIATQNAKNRVVGATKIRIEDLKGGLLEYTDKSTVLEIDNGDNGKVVSIGEIPKSKGAKQAERGLETGRKEESGPFSSELQKNILRLEARAATNRQVAMLNKAKERLLVNINGNPPALPEVAAKSKELLVKIDKVLDIYADPKVQEDLSEAVVSFDEYLFVIGADETVNTLQDQLKEIGISISTG